MKLYIAALLAFSDLLDADDPDARNTLTEQIPAVLMANSIDEAAERIRVQMMERWEPEQGWHTHQANVMPAPKALLDSLRIASSNDTLEVSDEEPLTFNF